MPRVEPPSLHDAQGRACLDVDLSGQHVDEKVGAEVMLPPFRCLHLQADDATTYTPGGLRQLAYRSGHRSIVTTDELPPAMRDAYDLELLRVLDWLTGAAA